MLDFCRTLPPQLSLNKLMFMVMHVDSTAPLPKLYIAKFLRYFFTLKLQFRYDLKLVQKGQVRKAVKQFVNSR